ncbi:MAG: bifunctional lysylphosphatidylglycerol synthetase/lysine--tRNA ligase LysX [Actinomycetes bacterium]
MTQPPVPPTFPEQVAVRREKRERLRAAGVDPYPVGYPRTDTAAEVRERFGDLAADHVTGERVAVAGRVILSRISGRLCFAMLRDGSGDLQVMVSANGVGSQRLADWKSDVDLGDHVGITGEVITSRTGELSVLAESWTLTSKCLRPLPEKHKGLTDPEARRRRRYVDLIVNPDSRRMLEIRTAATKAVRDDLSERGFLEVETPMLQSVHGGANARPFVTRSNAYGAQLYLRIACELYLKRLVVGGVEKVFEINRNFRNEGADSTHNPEFTMLEAYQTYTDYHVMADLTAGLIQNAAKVALGSTVVTHPLEDPVEGATVAEYDIGGPWPRITVHDAVSAALGEQVDVATPASRLAELAEQVGIGVDPSWGAGALLLEMYEHLVERRTVMPTFYFDFPTEVSPLTRAHREDSRLAERWDLVAFGAEVATAYSELVDPVEQRRRLTEQSVLAARGDPEAMSLDEDFLQALEYAMPPTGGMGMGMDRMLMLFTGRSIRDTILFPFVRPE